MIKDAATLGIHLYHAPVLITEIEIVLTVVLRHPQVHREFGAFVDCPADLKSTAECRAAGGVCDVAESCDGVNNDCPADTLVASGTVCRPQASACDAATLTPAPYAYPCDVASTAPETREAIRMSSAASKA